MRRPLIALSTAFLLALVAGACDDGHWHHDGMQLDSYCAQFPSCGTCTPVSGCGWCTNGDGTGSCTDGPGDCVGNEFRWTWDPPGCLNPADASVVEDGGGPAPDTGAPPADASEAQSAD